MRFLVAFGVVPEHRDALRSVLEEVSQHGGLTLQQSYDLASARVHHENGSTDSEAASSSD